MFDNEENLENINNDKEEVSEINLLTIKIMYNNSEDIEIKIFEDHLKEMREKSKETNTKVIK